MFPRWISLTRRSPVDIVSSLRFARERISRSHLSIEVLRNLPGPRLQNRSACLKRVVEINSSESLRYISVCLNHNSTMTRQDNPKLLTEKITNSKDVSNSNKHRQQSTLPSAFEKAESDKKNIIANRTFNSFHSMAAIQKLATEPNREHIENIRKLLKHTNAKNNNDQQITLEKDNITGIGSICIRSAAKNGISAKMMCDFLDTIDELYSWEEGKGVIIYGHEGFFCSGKYRMNSP